MKPPPSKVGDASATTTQGRPGETVQQEHLKPASVPRKSVNAEPKPKPEREGKPAGQPSHTPREVDADGPRGQDGSVNARTRVPANDPRPRDEGTR